MFSYHLLNEESQGIRRKSRKADFEHHVIQRAVLMCAQALKRSAEMTE